MYGSPTTTMPESAPNPAPGPLPTRNPPSFLRIVLAVFWSFFGVRKGRDLLADASNIKPQHLIVAGLIGALIVIFSLLLLVRLIIRSTGA
jgi:hypothetical protein